MNDKQVKYYIKYCLILYVFLYGNKWWLPIWFILEQVISIVDRDLVEEMGLSFHDVSACNETWRMICNAIGKNPHENNDVIEDIDLPDITNNENFLDKLLDEVH